MLQQRQMRIAFGIITVALVIIIAAGSWLLFFREDAYEFSSGVYDPPNPAASLDGLIDQDGNAFSLEDHKGKVVMLYFGYTYCPNYCPTTMVDMTKMKDELGDKADQVDVVMVSVDPARDTPERLGEWMGLYDPTFIGITGTEDQLTPIERAYGITVVINEPVDGTDYYSVDHSTQLYAIDPDGNLRLTWPYGAPVDEIAADVEHLLAD